MAFVGLFMLLFVGLWLLNWFAVTVVTGALGLRRRRWGTPGRGWTMVSRGAGGGVGRVLNLDDFRRRHVHRGGAGHGVGVAGDLRGWRLALWTGSHLAQAWALILAWRAADEAQALRFRSRSSD